MAGEVRFGIMFCSRTRTGFECSNAQAVLDGGIDGFISAYLKWINTKEETE